MECEPDEYTAEKYLTAKRTVDDRALHRPTIDRLVEELAARAGDRSEPLRILEVGVGVGTMLERLLAWELLPPGPVEYVGVDQNPAAIEAARNRARSLSDHEPSEAAAVTIERTDGQRITAEYHIGDALAFAEKTDPVDLLIGMAFVDLIDLPHDLSTLCTALRRDGLAYFPITFDGETIFTPVSDPQFESQLLDTYHATMDASDRPGTSTTGRSLLHEAVPPELSLCSAGGSDWVVHPVRTEPPHYAADEAYFLHHIVNTVHTAVESFEPPLGIHSNPIDTPTLEQWAETRHNQIGDGELTYVAHQYDLLFAADANRT